MYAPTPLKQEGTLRCLRRHRLSALGRSARSCVRDLRNRVCDRCSGEVRLTHLTCAPSPLVEPLFVARWYPAPRRVTSRRRPIPTWGVFFLPPLYRSNNRHRSRFASRQAVVLTLLVPAFDLLAHPCGMQLGSNSQAALGKNRWRGKPWGLPMFESLAYVVLALSLDTLVYSLSG
jgi:hypothetical protein